MKGMADIRKKIFSFRKMDNLYLLMASNDRPEKAVVGSYKKMVLRFEKNRPPATTHPRVNYRDMDSPFGEKTIGLKEKISGLSYVTHFYLVTDIDYPGMWVDCQNNPFHNSGVGVTEAEICY